MSEAVPFYKIPREGRCNDLGEFGRCELDPHHEGDHQRGGTPPVRSRWTNAASPIPQCSSITEGYYQCWGNAGHKGEHRDGMGRRWHNRDDDKMETFRRRV